MKRGFILRPLLDEDLEPTTRAALLADERAGETGWVVNSERVTIDPATVAEVVALQRIGGAS